ncbi:MAG: hypothetical protein KJ880_03195 [Candidatus Omnitrophica bacterium]|nr:hypothetical protein [Candidatus Omnitrophota bacterium]MBU1870072.1 hypothetical protein [Candidatus Omnitrophota bacterium]
MEEAIKRSVGITVVLVVLVASAIFAFGLSSWAFGFLIGASWSIINLLVTVSLFKMAVLKKSKKDILVHLMIKFPLLYLTGGLVLMSGLFPAVSLLTGMLPIFAVTGIIMLCSKNSPI